jgi:hypothetical protein
MSCSRSTPRRQLCPPPSCDVFRKVRKQQVVENVCAHAGLIELLKRGALIEQEYLDRYGK